MPTYTYAPTGKTAKGVIGEFDHEHVSQVAGGPVGSVFGNTWYVDSGATNAADTTNHGQSRKFPFATIDYAIGRCVADQGDTILVAPGHAETVSAAGTIDCDVAGIKIIGCGHGSLRPTITFSTLDTATIEVDAANVWIEGLWFVCNKDSLQQMIRISAAHCTIKDCVFIEGSALQALDYIELDNAAADYCTIQGCRIISETSGSATGIAINAAVNELAIIDCDIQGDFSTACIDSASAHLNCRVLRNVLRNDGASDHAIEFTAAATGIIAWNAIQTAVTAGGASDVIDCGSCGCVENYAADADANTSGVLTPPAT
jgi:hypothetical protein